MSSPQRCVGCWALGTELGSGSFAVVWRAKHVESGQEAAVKEINLSKLNAKLRQSLESEVSILKRVNHENIVKLHEVLEESDRLYLVMEYCAGGDLAHFLRRVKRVPESVARHLMRQLAAGLRQMWCAHLVHRDLKPQNLLLSAVSPNATLKIADFGFARNLQPQGLAETLCGSPLYMAPEILHFHKYDAKADLWSCGAILYELVVGRPPFTGANQFQLLRNIERSEARVPEAIAAQLSPPCRHLIHCLLRRNPVERLSFEEFFRHPFIATPEEMAVPLPPRVPFGASGAAASVIPAGSAPGKPAGAPLQQAPPPHTLLFSTSAPVKPTPASIKPQPTHSIPQQVLGFQQQQQMQQQLHSNPGGGDSAGRPGMPGSHAHAAVGAAVPLGGLSHQLKPRRSLELEGLAAAQLQQLPPPQQRRPQPVPGHRLGSIQRVQGFQPAPLLGQQPPGPRAVQQQYQRHPPHAGAATVAAAATAAAALSQQQQQGRLAGAGAGAAAPPIPTSQTAALVPGTRQAPRPQQGPVAAAAAQHAGRPCGSFHSEDEDYVMVDAALSAHTAAARSSTGRPQSAPLSRSASAEGSLGNDSHHTYASTEEDIFAAPHTDTLGTPAVAAGAAVPSWLGTSRWHFLQRVARILQAAAAARQAAAVPGRLGAALPGAVGSAGVVLSQAQPHPQPQALSPQSHQLLRECLSLHLAALQLLEHAMEAHTAAAAAVATADAATPASAAGAGGAEVAAPGHEEQRLERADAGEQWAVEVEAEVEVEEDSAAQLAASALQLQQEASAGMDAAEAAAAALDKAVREPSPTTVTPAAAALADADAALPDPWELLYVAALGWGRDAAVDELLGNQQRSCRLYARAGTVLSFLCTEAAGLELEPPVELGPADRMRLQKYAAATAARWAACVAAAGDAAAATGDH